MWLPEEICKKEKLKKKDKKKMERSVLNSSDEIHRKKMENYTSDCKRSKIMGVIQWKLIKVIQLNRIC